ncbi:hypothetical protein [Salinimicrobium sediminilitoris]|uniref:hypothetical protein n=1 Tax=Salinimicrobium sediminilitoris TaxID=2876715 RepID=UPI001E6090EC|nr:hypothetical protein [Salinimicrobium sediminilitoris]MCC8361188.1 hypothetical protein [Salinimicrobium sediminilitoris]
MKTVIFYLVLLVLGTSHAQEFTELKEANVGFAPMASSVERNGNSFSFNVKEAVVGEFEKDPLAFMENYFSIEDFISELKPEQYDRYEVSFVSQKGQLIADFDKNGKLVQTNSRFKNTLLPHNLRNDLYRDHKGWAMTKNIRITRGKNGDVSKDYYKINLENGKDRKKIVLQAPVSVTDIASN